MNKSNSDERNGRTKRNPTKSVRALLDDWMYLDRLAGKGPMREAIKECVRAHKELKGAGEVDMSPLDSNDQTN